MKKLLLMVAMLAAIAPIGAQAGHNGREVSATISLPTARNGADTVSRQARCAATLGLQNDVVGHVESLDAEEGDGSHEFTLTAANAGVDFDVIFYVDMGTCDANAVGVTPFQQVGDEAGTIPEGATAAIVVFQAPGANEAFTLAIS